MLQPAIENITGYLNLDRNPIKGEGCYFLTVEGDSMINKGILSGDIVLIRPQQVANNGEVVAVMHSGIEHSVVTEESTYGLQVG